MIPFIAKTLFCTTHMFLSYQPQEIYPLLCPVREYEWIETWNCDMIRSQSGVNEKGCIFRTNFPGLGGPEIWVTSVFEPAERVEFVRTSPCVVSILQITLSPESNGTHLTWTQTMTALNEDGNLILENYNPADFEHIIQQRATELDIYLSNHKKDGSDAAPKCIPSAN
jgi:hypothetical protein